MKTPYELLAVTELATDVEIKQAYLQQVKLNPPERDQAKFQQLHIASQQRRKFDSCPAASINEYDVNCLLLWQHFPM